MVFVYFLLHINYVFIESFDIGTYVLIENVLRPETCQTDSIDGIAGRESLVCLYAVTLGQRRIFPAPAPSVSQPQGSVSPNEFTHADPAAVAPGIRCCQFYEQFGIGHFIFLKTRLRKRI